MTHLQQMIAEHGEPPEWFSWTEDRTVEYVREELANDSSGNFRHDGVPILSCDNCDSLLVYAADRPVWADIEVRDDRFWVSLRYQDEILLRRNHLSRGGFSFDTEHYEDQHFGDSSYDYLCSACHESLEQENSYDSEYEDGSEVEGVHDYGYRPAPTFFSYTENVGVTGSRRPSLSALGQTGVRSPASLYGEVFVQQPYFGFELEMTREGRSSWSLQDAANRIVESCGAFSYLKWDGSVDNGFELVTHPHTLEAHTNRTELWTVLDALRRNGWRSWNSHSSCGLHIHINNASFASYGHAMRFLLFIYKNREPLIRFAGRDSHFARFDLDQFVQREYVDGWNDDGSPIMKVGTVGDVVKKKQVNDNRYLAVNCRNTNTYELRFFRGNLNPKAVLACLEFVACLHEYTQNLTSHDCLVNRALTWRPFLAFVRRGSASAGFRYRNLYERLTMARRNGDNGFINTAGAE